MIMPIEKTMLDVRNPLYLVTDRNEDMYVAKIGPNKPNGRNGIELDAAAPAAALEADEKTILNNQFQSSSDNKKLPKYKENQQLRDDWWWVY